MAKHHPDLIFCRKQPGVCKLLVMENALYVIPMCAQYVMNVITVHIKAAVSFVVVLGSPMLITADSALSWKKMYVHPIYLTRIQRDGCPKIVNLGSAKTDLFYERKKYGFKKR
ncbi:unnamed protein product [Schistocephalus solidus]|uniref:DNA helicase n=1 Tax=Schistocephalus solidus TaxID=70667 RepID=A0A183TA14_SCHSO|nr:unnamed protein product [Schistocephalus solidus]